jgi:hypothetical protein
MAKSGQQHTKADEGGQRADTPRKGDAKGQSRSNAMSGSSAASLPKDKSGTSSGKGSSKKQS